MRGRTTPGAAVAVALAGALLCACSSGNAAGRPTPAQSQALHIPLASSGIVAGLGTGAGATSPAWHSPAAWAILPVSSPTASGEIWELLVLGGRRRTWSVVTPPGVSDVDGLVGSFSSSSGLVGVEASRLLAFSPMATTPTGDARWTPRWSFGAFPGSLAPVPDAVAVGQDGRWLALFGASGTSLGGVYAPGGALGVESRSVLAAVAGRGCDLVSLTAVAFGPDGAPVAGGTCAEADEIGLFTLANGGWRLVGPPLPAAVTGGAASGGRATGSTTSTPASAAGVAARTEVTEVLGVADSASRLDVLAEAVAGNGTASIVRFTRDAAGDWTSSAPYDVPPSQSLLATGVASDGSSFLLLSSDGGRRAELLAGAGARWGELPAPPVGTATLVLEPGRTEALVAGTASVGIYGLEGGRTWTELQDVALPSAPTAPA